MITHISEIKELVKEGKMKTVVLAVAQDKHALNAIVKAVNNNYIKAILVGNIDMVKKIASDNNYDISRCEQINETDVVEAVKISIKLIREKRADILMKGKVATGTLLKGVLNKEHGLRKGELLSHFALFELENYHKLIALTDVAINISPDTKAKISIINNSVAFLNRLGIKNPKVAVLTAVETINQSMTATTDAALISKMNERKQIRNCIIDGPLSFDLATSSVSAEYKGIKSEVTGNADLLMFPNIESGNMVYKALVQFSNPIMACLVLGAKVPIVLTSRSDSEATKLNSILLAAAIA